MSLKFDEHGDAWLSWTVEMRVYLSAFPGDLATAAVSQAAVQKEWEAAWRPRGGALDEHAFSIAASAMDAKAWMSSGCFDELSIVAGRLDEDGGVEQWEMICVAKLNDGLKLMAAGKKAARDCWGDDLMVQSLEQAAYELGVASNDRRYAPLTQGYELMGTYAAETEFSVWHAFMEAKEIKRALESKRQDGLPGAPCRI